MGLKLRIYIATLTECYKYKSKKKSILGFQKTICKTNINSIQDIAIGAKSTSLMSHKTSLNWPFYYVAF